MHCVWARPCPSSSLSSAATLLKGTRGVDSPGQACPSLSSHRLPRCLFSRVLPAPHQPVGPMSTGTVAGLPSGVSHVRGTH